MNTPSNSPNTFHNLDDIKNFPPPHDRHVVYLRHDQERWFTVAISKPRQDGYVKRSYVVRLGQTRRRIGEVVVDQKAPPGAIGFKEARLKAKELHAEHERHGSPRIALTLHDVWVAYRKEKEAEWAPDTLSNYLRWVPPTLDEIEKEEKAADAGAERGKRDLATKDHLVPVWQKRIATITSEHLEKLLQDIRNKVSKNNRKRKPEDATLTGQATVSSVGAFLRALFSYAADQGWIKHNPMMSSKCKTLIKQPEPRSSALKATQVPAFWKWLWNPDACYVAARDFILCALFLGLRKSALGSMRVTDVDPHNWTIQVQRETKGNKRRQLVVLPIPKLLVDNVFEPRLAHPTSEWLIESPMNKGRPLRDIRGVLGGSLKKRTGIAATPHMCRRSGATWIYSASGSDLLISKRWLTHHVQSPLDRDATTSGYLITSTEQLRAAMEASVKFVEKIVAKGLTVEEYAEYERVRAMKGIGADDEEAMREAA